MVPFKMGHCHLNGDDIDDDDSDNVKSAILPFLQLYRLWKPLLAISLLWASYEGTHYNMIRQRHHQHVLYIVEIHVKPQ